MNCFYVRNLGQFSIYYAIHKIAKEYVRWKKKKWLQSEEVYVCKCTFAYEFIPNHYTSFPLHYFSVKLAPFSISYVVDILNSSYTELIYMHFAYLHCSHSRLSLLASFLTCKNHSLYHLIYGESCCYTKYYRVHWNHAHIKELIRCVSNWRRRCHGTPRALLYCFPALEMRTDCLNLCGMSLYFFQWDLVAIHQLYIWRLIVLAHSSCKSFLFSKNMRSPH